MVNPPPPEFTAALWAAYADAQGQEPGHRVRHLERAVFALAQSRDWRPLRRFQVRTLPAGDELTVTYTGDLDLVAIAARHGVELVELTSLHHTHHREGIPACLTS